MDMEMTEKYKILKIKIQKDFSACWSLYKYFQNSAGVLLC